jgi:hypothetical protein
MPSCYLTVAKSHFHPSAGAHGSAHSAQIGPIPIRRLHHELRFIGCVILRSPNISNSVEKSTFPPKYRGGNVAIIYPPLENGGYMADNELCQNIPRSYKQEFLTN